ncbi:MAG: hypothetical protein LUD22_03015, partial [Coprobacillus sp.]|nr:hypothetical protein [Coprobacillus sp.]
MKKSKLLMLLSVLVLSLSSCGSMNSRATSESKTSESETSESSFSESQESEQTSQSEPTKEEESSGTESPSIPESYTYSISIVNLTDLATFEVGDSKDIEVSLYTNNPALSGVTPTNNNVTIVLDNDYMTIYGFTLTAYYPGETLVTVSWIESGVNLASTSFTVSITGEARETVLNPTISISIKLGGINQTIPTYSEAYVIGEWNNWNPTKLEEVTRDEVVTYETMINELSTRKTYTYQVVLLYKDTDPALLTDIELYTHRLTTQNQSFEVHPDNEDGYIYNLTVYVNNQLNTIIPQKTFSNVSIVFHIYMYDDLNRQNELEPLDSDYATLYIYGFSGNEFAACSIEDNHYVLHLETIETGTYNYSALLYYADEELPDEIDDSFWQAHKVNDGLGSREGDEQYIIDDSFVSDDSSVDAYFYAGMPLEDLVPDLTIYPKYNVTINFTITVVNTTTEVSPLEYGTLYIYGLKGEEFIACEQDEDTLKYSLTIEEIDAGTYKYSALIYYSDETLPSGAASDPSFWAKYKVNTGEYGSGIGDETLVVDKTLEDDGGTIDASFSALKPLNEILEDLRVYDGPVSITFNITAYGESEPESALDYGDLYIYGFTGSEFAKCEVDNGQYVLHLDSLRAGTYKYSALIYYNDEELPEGDALDSSFWAKYKVNDGEGERRGDETLEVSYEVLVQNCGAITTSFIAAQPLADILPAKLSSLTLEFHMWYNHEENEQYALSYMTCYFYSAEYDPDNFI